MLENVKIKIYKEGIVTNIIVGGVHARLVNDVVESVAAVGNYLDMTTEETFVINHFGFRIAMTVEIPMFIKVAEKYGMVVEYHEN